MIANTIILLLLVCLGAANDFDGHKTSQFLTDLRDHFGALDAVTICQPDRLVLEDILGNHSEARMVLTPDYSQRNAVAHELGRLMRMDKLDMITIVGTVEYSTAFLHYLESRLELMRSKIYVVVPGVIGFRRPLRLDSRLFIYKRSREGFNIWEKYAVKSGRPMMNRVGTWSESSGLRVPVDDMWFRRSDLRGVTLANTIVPFAVFNKVSAVRSNGELYADGEVEGIFQDMLQFLAQALNFTASNRLSRDGKWGAPENVENRTSWNGMIGMLVDGEADLCTNTITVTRGRHDAVDFSYPLMDGQLTLVAPAARGGKGAAYLWAYVVIFSAGVWAACVTMIMVLCAYIYFLDATGSEGLLHAEEKVGLLHGLSSCMLLLMQLHSPRDPAPRILFLVASTAFYILYSVYTANLTAMMTLGSPEMDIASFGDAVAKGYRVVVVDSSAVHITVRSSPPGSGLHAVSEASSLVDTLSEALKRVWAEERTLLVGTDEDVLGDSRYRTLRLADSLRSNMGWAFGKDSELTEFFNYHLYRLKESGVYVKIFKVRHLFFEDVCRTYPN